MISPLIALFVLVLAQFVACANADRPPVQNRLFRSASVDAFIESTASRMASPVLATLFRNCFPNPLDTTVHAHHAGTFVVTGDIDAMWLRDSTEQMLPFMRFAPHDQHLQQALCGVIHTQSKQVLIDPYANAFNLNASGAGHQDDERTPPMTPDIFEGKYELDSLANVLRLANRYFEATKDAACLLKNDMWISAVQKIVHVVEVNQESTPLIASDSNYLFARRTDAATDTLMLQSRGPPARRCGLSKSFFRPSDDATTFPFHIPSNAMMAVELNRTAQNLIEIYPLEKNASILANRMIHLSEEITSAILKHGIVPVRVFDESSGEMTIAESFAYEVDGYGNSFFMDDGNIPSLLSLPLLGFISRNDSLYLTTRALALSSRNPYYFNGSKGAGIGGPHVGLGYIWPLSVTVQALTSESDDEIESCLRLLERSAAKTGFMHESFWKDDVDQFTRPWFAWANALFGELIVTLANFKPHLIFNSELASQ